jgi:hypothetical protein
MKFARNAWKQKKPGLKVLDLGSIDIQAMYEQLCFDATITQQWHTAKTIQERWGIIREVYKHLTPEIMESGEEGSFGLVDPYPVDWLKIFTPIEYDAWQSIRYRGIGLYPQYPVYNYFLDFGNPFLKVALEMDGKAHSLTRDIERDLKLIELGWHIYRIKGVECYAKFKPYWEIEDSEYMDDEDKWNSMRDYYYYTSDGVIDAIAMIYFNKSNRRRSKYFDFAYQTLDKHRLVPFEIGKGEEVEEDDQEDWND